MTTKKESTKHLWLDKGQWERTKRRESFLDALFMRRLSREPVPLELVGWKQQEFPAPRPDR